jgi:hypothetical protein
MIFTTDQQSAQYELADALMQRHLEARDISETDYNSNWEHVTKQSGDWINMKNQLFLAPLINSLPPIYLDHAAKMTIIGHGAKKKPHKFIGGSGQELSPEGLAKMVVGWLTTPEGKIARIARITLFMCWGAGRTSYEDTSSGDGLGWETEPEESFAYSFASYLGQVTPLVIAFTSKAAAKFTAGDGTRATGLPKKLQVHKGLDRDIGEFKMKFHVNAESTLSDPQFPSYDDPLTPDMSVG